MIHKQSRKNREKGFTLVELILTVALLGFLTISALPSFQSLTEEAKQGARDGVVGSVRAGLKMYYAKQLVSTNQGSYPAALDGASSGATETLFSNVVDPPVADSQWTKTSATSYSFNDGSATYVYDYDSSQGTFTSADAP